MARIGLGVTAVLVAVLAAAPSLADARDKTVATPAIDTSRISVDHMPPVMRAAYLKGIRDELIAHGYDPGPDNSAIGPRFSAAIRTYQRDAGLRPDGVASKELLDHLLFALPKVYADGSRGVPAPTAASGNARIALAPPARIMRHGTDEPVPTPAPRGHVSKKALPENTPNSDRAIPRQTSRPAFRAPRAGSDGFVSRTQRALRDRGYYQGQIDGRYSDGLANAIRAFQKNNRLPVTGVIDGPLLEALS